MAPQGRKRHRTQQYYKVDGKETLTPGDDSAQ